MKYEELLLDYIDGTLDSSREEELFFRLTSSEELRGKLRHMIALENAAAGQTVPGPPKTAEAALFAGLGFTSTEMSSSSSTLKKSLIGGKNAAIASGLLSSLATAALIFLLILPQLNQHESDISLQKKNPEPTLSNITQASPIIKSIEKVPEPEIIERTKIEYVYLTNNEFLPNNNETVKKDVFIRSSKGSYENNKLLTFQEKSPLSSRRLEYEIVNYTPGNIRNISVEMRGSQYLSFPEADIMPGKEAMFNNTGISLFYNLNDNLFIGADIRRENFFQKFTGADAAGRKINYEQNPNFTSYSAGIRYYLLEKEKIRPFGQFFGGGNIAGILGRGMIGVQWSPYPDFSFVLGAEYSLFWYLHSDEIFNASKAGLHYGINYRF
mgnify:CR=1 FL=1